MRQKYGWALVPAFLSFAVIGIVGALGAAAHQPWLFPSLGPTIFLQAVSPEEPAARPRNTFLGHAIGVVAGFGALFLFGAQDAPSAFASDALSLSRVAATGLAVGATVLFQSLAGAKHPPAAATTMLITLGGMRPGWSAVLAIAAGVALVTGLGQLLRVLVGASQCERLSSSREAARQP